jgi:hypothetical protein
MHVEAQEQGSYQEHREDYPEVPHHHSIRRTNRVASQAPKTITTPSATGFGVQC